MMGELLEFVSRQNQAPACIAIWVNYSNISRNVRITSLRILDPYRRIPAETWKAGDDMVVADLDASLLEVSTSRRWIVTRQSELYEPLTVPTGLEQDTRTVRFDKKGV
jgi:hypothetical protein